MEAAYTVDLALNLSPVVRWSVERIVAVRARARLALPVAPVVVLEVDSARVLVAVNDVRINAEEDDTTCAHGAMSEMSVLEPLPGEVGFWSVVSTIKQRMSESHYEV